MSRYPGHLSANITPTKSGKAQKSRTRREPSGVFSLFQPQQIQQFKEAFSLVDQDRDGLVGEQDLKDTFASLGIMPSIEMLEEMLTSRPGERGQLSSSSAEDRGINFAMFLTMMSEHLFEFDAEAELTEAFSSFDESDSGTVRCDEIRKWLSETGDRMSQAEINRFLKGSFTDRQGNFNYKEWVKVLRVNEDDNDTEAHA
ncbi:EF-hand [Russula dissimulans]|nr:EF-hand [Russula dissimulans]